MQSVSNTYKQVVSSTSALSPKTKIIIDGVEYLGDVIKTSPKITHSNTSFIGGFPAKTVSFDIFDLESNLNLENKEITIYRGIVINNEIEYVKQGVFIVRSKDIKHDISSRTIKVSNAQDKTQLFDSKYESSLDWSSNHTGLEIVQEICTKLNVNLETTNFAWANYSFKQPNFSNMTTYREVISRIAEIGGEVALISANGGLQIKGQYATGDTIQRHRYEKLSKEKPFVVNTIALGKDGIDDDIVYKNNNLIDTPYGKNLLNYLNIKTSTNGLTSVVNDDGSITTTGTPTTDYVRVLAITDITDILEDGETYTISQTIASALRIEVRVRKDGVNEEYYSSHKGSISFVVDKSNYTYDISLVTQTITNTGTLNITNFYQLEKKSTATEFEPYQTTGVKEYRIEDNPFVDLYRQEMIENVANYVIGKSYTPFELNGFVDGFIYELNDVIEIVDKNGDTFNAVILDYSIQSRIKSNVKAEIQDKNKTNYNLVGSKAKAIGQVKLEVDHINETITALTSRVEDLTDYLKSASGTGTLTLNNTIESDGSIGKLIITGFTEIGLYPSVIYPSSKVYPSKLTTYCIVQTNEDGTLVNETYIDLGSALSKTDELIIENSNVYIKSGTTIKDTGIIVLLKTYENTTKISVKYFPNVSFTCDYIIQNELTKIFTTEAEVSSLFKMTQENINSKVTKAEVVSEINQSAEQIKISADKINLNGYISNNDGSFEITQDGKAKFKDVTITGGDINLLSGGKVIGGDGILTNLQFVSIGKFEGYGLLGFNYNSFDDTYFYGDISIDVDIPDNFTIIQAYLTLYHTPATWSYYNSSTSENIDIQGYARNLKLYETLSDNQNYGFYMTFGGDYAIDLSSGFLTEITNAFGDSSYTPNSGYSTGIEVKKTIDIKDYLTKGSTHKLVVRTSDSIPVEEMAACSKTGMARAVINIIGYMSM